MVRIILMFLLSSTAFSMPTPDFLKDGQVQVTTKNGKKHQFSSNEWFVGNRAASDRYHAKLNARMKELKDKIMLLQQSPEFKKHHRLTFHLGYGFTGIELKRFSNGVDIYQKPGVIGGLSYSYSFTDRYNITFTGLTSVAGFVGFGLNW